MTRRKLRQSEVCYSIRMLREGRFGLQWLRGSKASLEYFISFYR